MTEAQTARLKPSRSQPEFAKKLRSLQQSDPVDPVELTRRLEICFAEQEQGVKRTLRPVRSSSDTSLDGSGPSTPKKKARPLTFHPDNLARTLDFHQRKESDSSKPVAIVIEKKSKRQSAPLLSQSSINADISSPKPPPTELLSNELPTEVLSPLSLDTPNTPRQKLSMLGIQRTSGQDDPLEDKGASKEQNNIISTVAGHLTPNQSPRTAKHKPPLTLTLPTRLREGATFNSPQPSPLPFLLPLSALGESFADSIHGTQSEHPASADEISLDSASTPTKGQGSASSSGYPSTTPSSVPLSSPPKSSVRADKHKSWLSLVASRKSKFESNKWKPSQSSTVTIQSSGHVNMRRKSGISPYEGVRIAGYGIAAGAKGERRMTTALENTSSNMSNSSLQNPNDTPVPSLVLPGDGNLSLQTEQVSQDGAKKDNVWKLFSLRRTPSNEQDSNKMEKPVTKATEHLRSKELAMRQRAICDAKRPKEEKMAIVVSEDDSVQKELDMLEAQLQELQEQQVRERQQQQQLAEEKRLQRLEEEKRRQEIAEAKRRHQQIEASRQRQLEEGKRLQEERSRELQARTQAEKERQEKTQKEQEIRMLQSQAAKLIPSSGVGSRDHSRSPSSLSQSLVTSRHHSRAPSAASMKPWAPPPRVSSTRATIPRTPLTPPGASRQPSLVELAELIKERAVSPNNCITPISPASRSVTPVREKQSAIITGPPQGIVRPRGPFSCPRPPPRIDSLAKRPVINHSRPTSQDTDVVRSHSRATSQSRPVSRGGNLSRPVSRGGNLSRPMSHAESQVTPRQVTYSNNERPGMQPLRSRTSSFSRYAPSIDEDVPSFLHRSRSSSTLRPKSRSGTPSIPADIPEFDVTGMTTESKRLFALQREQLLTHKAQTTSAIPTLRQFSRTPNYRRISRFYSNSPPRTASLLATHETVERIPGMTPESVIFLRQQEKLAAERFGWDIKTFTVADPPHLRRHMTEGNGGVAAEINREKNWKKEKWYKVWKLG